MKLENRFTVPVEAAVAWDVLLDVARIAPCMPGATLTGTDGDTFSGKVKVKLGPISLTYGGTARFLSRDEVAKVVVIEASGKETRGTGTAKATVTARLVERAGSTDVEVDTDLAITGKPAQFGRGVLADVSGKIIDQFAACLAEEIQGGSAGTPSAVAPSPAVEGASAASDGATPAAAEAAVPAAGSAAPSSAPVMSAAAPVVASSQPSGPPTPRSSPRPAAEAIDLLGTAGAPVLKRAVPALAALVVLLAVLRALRRR